MTTGDAMREMPKKPRPEQVARCPLCRGAKKLPALAKGGGLPAAPERVCNLCDGAGELKDRQSERPKVGR